MAYPNEIRNNAQTGSGSCTNCSAHVEAEGRFVNPGLMNYEGELIFVSEEPRHPTDWESYDSWEEYNEEWSQRFSRARGGRFINRLLSKTELRLEDVWVADSVKCPTKADLSRGIPVADTNSAVHHCQPYLKEEIEQIDPRGIVTLGNRATIRTLRALGVPASQTPHVRVTKEYGRYMEPTPYPLVISLHWAQRTLAENEWVPVVQEQISQLVSEF